MDNPSRSERSRKAALVAALTIVARDGAGRLTLDAIARESGLSKGGLMHQFRTKEAVLRALLEQQMAHFGEFTDEFRRKNAASLAHPELATQIATSREIIAQQYSVAQAMLAALSSDPKLLVDAREQDASRVELIKAEATDPELAVLRWAAARGLALLAMLRLCPIPEAELEPLFARLIDDRQWTAFERPAKATTVEGPAEPKISKPKPSAPKPSAPKPSAPKPSTPKPSAPKASTPRPSARGRQNH
jgi:AcrR family transcriptional regulator